MHVSKLCAAAVILSWLMVGCGDDGPSDRPGDFVIRDMGPPDFGVVVCEGTAEPCASIPLESCDTAAGCFSGTCGGSAPSCLSYDFITDCERAGCLWDFEFDWCEGSAPRCDFWGSSRERCENAGCDWIVSPSCEGTPPACDRLDLPNCRSTPGCFPIGEAPADLGMDSGTPDLGIDGGPPGSMCPAGECDFGTNTGCAAGEGCYLGTGGAPICLDAGSTPLGGSCAVQDDCVPGMVCLGSGDSGYCRRICCADDDSVCGAGSSCAEITDVDGVGGCTLACNPVAQTGCFFGEACYSLPTGAECAPPGAGTQGTSCEVQNDCAAGFGCVADSDTTFACAEYCDRASPSCTDDSLTCVGLMGSDAGACLE